MANTNTNTYFLQLIFGENVIVSFKFTIYLPSKLHKHSMFTTNFASIMAEKNK